MDDVARLKTNPPTKNNRTALSIAVVLYARFFTMIERKNIQKDGRVG